MKHLIDIYRESVEKILDRYRGKDKNLSMIAVEKQLMKESKETFLSIAKADVERLEGEVWDLSQSELEPYNSRDYYSGCNQSIQDQIIHLEKQIKLITKE